VPSVIDVRALRRRPLYPTELRRRIQFLAYFLGFLAFGSHPHGTGFTEIAKEPLNKSLSFRS